MFLVPGQSKENIMMKQTVSVAILSLAGLWPLGVCAQTMIEKSPAKPLEEQTAKANEEMLAGQRRAYAIAQVVSLTDEARRYTDQGRRAHVLARAADTLWEADRGTSPAMFVS